MCDTSEYTYTKRTSGEVGGGGIDVRGNLRMGIRVIYEGRHSPLIIILQSQKHFAPTNNKRSRKKYEHIFSELAWNPTPIEVGPHGKCLYPAHVWTLFNKRF